MRDDVDRAGVQDGQDDDVTRRPGALRAAAREAGASDPEQLGEQLALLLDGASARSRVLDAETLASAAAIATVLVDNAIPTATV